MATKDLSTFTFVTTMRRLLLFFGLLTLSSSVGASEKTTAASSRELDPAFKPHILFVVVDDMGTKDLGAFGSGIQTPVIDGLLNSGVYLKNFYTHPECSPTRFAIMTGRHPYRDGFYREIKYSFGPGLGSGEETLAHVVRRANYAAHAIGKWHIGGARVDQLPTHLGFQSFYGMLGGVTDYYAQEGGTLYAMRWEKEEFATPGTSNCVFPNDENTYNTFVLEREAKNVINQHNPADSPLFLYLAFFAPHYPLQVPWTYFRKYKDKRWKATRKIHAGMLTAADESLGRVIQSLKDKNMWSDTIVIFQSDNGATMPTCAQMGVKEVCGVAGLNKFRGEKFDVFDGGIHVDAFISGPGLQRLGIQPRRRTNILFHSVDWLPTIAAIVGTSPQGQVLDGKNQLDALRGGPATRKHVFLGYSTRWNRRLCPPPCQTTVNKFAAVRWKDYKLIRDENGSTFYLYNLVKNPMETVNLVSKVKPNFLNYLKRLLTWYEGRVNVDYVPDHCNGTFVWPKTSWGQDAIGPWTCENNSS